MTSRWVTWHISNILLLVCHVTRRRSHSVKQRSLLLRDQYKATTTSLSIFRKKNVQNAMAPQYRAQKIQKSILALNVLMDGIAYDYHLLTHELCLQLTIGMYLVMFQ